MGSSYKACCRSCGNHFVAEIGGGRRFEQVRCPACGSFKAIPHDQIRELVLKFTQELKQLDDLDGFDRVRDGFHRSVETYAGTCKCGAQFSFNAPPRCPACLSVDIDLGKPWRLYD